MWCKSCDRNGSGDRDSRMIQVFQYPHETLLQTSTAWTDMDSIQGYDDLEKFESDMIKLMLLILFFLISLR